MSTIIMGLPERFWAKTVIEDTGYATPCLTWTAYQLPNGYGRFSMNGEIYYAHRIAYEATHDLIPNGLVVDHLCRNRACVNADHMEAVTQRENIFRGVAVTAINAAKTHCLRGHEYTPENTISCGVAGRRCRTCTTAQRRERTRREYEARRKDAMEARIAQANARKG